jgi:arylsulfatase A-like enzyme
MKKLSLLAVFVIITIGIVATSIHLADNKTCNDCNIVVFDADIFRADGLDCEKSPEITPNICEFKNEFIKFSNHHSPTDLTKPGMASFFTSSYPSTHGAWNEFYFIDKNQPNIINVLKDNGYNTIINHPENKQVISSGYDILLEPSALELNVPDLIKDKKTFLFTYEDNLHYPYLSNDQNEVISHPNKPVNFPNNLSEYYDRGTEIIIKNHQETLNGAFAQDYIKNNGNSTKGLYRHIEESCWNGNREAMLVNNDYCWKLGKEIFEKYIDENNPDDLKFVKYLYQERIKEVDKKISKIIRDLKSNNLWDKTVFVIRSDHGEEFMEHGNIGHNNLYEKVARVPFWIHVPNKAEETINNLTQTIDEAPTILKAVGIKPHPLMQGRNLLEEKNYKSDVNFAIAQKNDGSIFSIREGNYKLLSITNDSELDTTRYELYNLEDDPDEKTNIVGTNHEIKERLLLKYYSTINQLPKFNPSNGSFNKLTDEQKSAIFKDGYF